MIAFEMKYTYIKLISVYLCNSMLHTENFFIEPFLWLIKIMKNTALFHLWLNIKNK